MNRVFKLLLITRRGPNFTPREVWSLKLQQRRNKISRERGSLAPSRQRRAGEQQTMTDGGPRDTPLYGLQVNLSVEPRGCALHEIMPGQLDRDWCVCSSPSCASVASPPALPRTFSPSPVASSAIIFAFVSFIFLDISLCSFHIFIWFIVTVIMYFLLRVIPFLLLLCMRLMFPHFCHIHHSPHLSSSSLWLSLSSSVYHITVLF